MPSRILIARLLWIFPLILLFLTVYLAKAAVDIKETLDEGEVVRAEVLELYKTGRVDVTYGFARLRVPMGGRLVERKLSMPTSFIEELEGRDSVDVRVRPGHDQEIVIVEVARPQWRMAAINAGISLLGFILLSIAVFSWNRYLHRRSDHE
ncbi:MAG: DUF3592 domain-containing protein [Rhodothermales bacterium]